MSKGRSNPMYGGGMASIETVDHFAADLGVVDDALAAEQRKVRRGEHRMALRMIEDAMEESLQAEKPRAQAEAREWLRDGLRLFSARVCFEALDLDYEASLQRLERQWARMDGKGKK